MKKKYLFLIILFLIVASFVSFGRIMGNEFINLDDGGYITENSHIQSGFNFKNIQWALTSVVVSNWHPLTLLSHMLDWQLFGANAAGHHLINLLLHIGTVILLFLFFNKTTNNIWPSAFAAAFFALHPLRVESVAWAAERKDVLSMFFGMAALYAYAFYAQSRKTSFYILSLILFALSLMAKSMLVTLPCLLLLLDYWPLKRWERGLNAQDNMIHHARNLILEKIPFFVLTIAVSIIAVWAQRKGGSVISVNVLPFSIRGINAIMSYGGYLANIFWPFNLGIFYHYWSMLQLWKLFVSGITILSISVVVVYYIRKLPFLFVGWYWYLGTLVPVIGLVQIGSQAMADRYTYMPSIGIAVLLAWGVPALIRRESNRKKFLFLSAMTVIAILMSLTWMQSGYWKNSITLWKHTLQATQDNYYAHRYLGSVYAERKNFPEAMSHYQKAIHIKADYAEAYFCRGNAFIDSGDYQSAIDDFSKTISLDSSYFDAFNNRAYAYLTLGQYGQAVADYSEAIRLKADYANAYNNRAFVYLSLGSIGLCCTDAKKACALGVCATLDLAKDKGYCR